MGHHPLSTLVHEMYHWKDAYEYRKKVGAIKDPETLKAYTVYQRETAFNELKKAGFDLNDMYKTKDDISEYAYRMQRENNFEEVLTEVRTAQLLGGK